ncbi:septin-7 isoform X2 [Chrysoperla carnea]|uniref:septin-7 isoform X2 n=1 Tax=Chrysoperla carnea TaxID=189513 RepID=UPI001D064CB4|nr:septin-7 isoform X2 [Chrysoperla carnea]
MSGSEQPNSKTSPNSYLYTSSSTLLNRNTEKPVSRPVPPPTLPKYTSSFNAGSNLTLRDREKEGIGGSYRLASLDRLALRQRLIDQNSTGTPPNQNMSNGNQTNGNDTVINSTNNSTTTSSIQSKRELFFKSESSPSSNFTNSTAAPTTNTTTDVKNSIMKKTATIDNVDTNKLSRVSIKNETPPEPPAKPPQEQIKLAQEGTKERPKQKEIDGYVGFANLPNQVYRKAVKRGFEFTLMVVGESGLGKSTLINSMFLTDIYQSEPGAEFPGPSQRIKKTVNVETSRVLLKENGVNLTLTVVDTPGFGDAVDNSNCWVPIIEFIENKYEEYLNCESRVTRKQIKDTRVHCCLYFIQPSGHGLKPLDIEFMQRLCDKVNIVPVIAKADTMTTDECQLFKKQILNEISQHKIKIYDFPEVLDDQEEEGKMNRLLRSKVPFAVVGSNAVIEVDGKKLRGRKYPWGIAEVENLEHCDFIALRNMVIRTHLQDLKDVTNNVHYENYRCRKLAGLGADGKPIHLSNKNPLAQMEEEKKEHDLKMKKMELEMEQVFEMKVKEKKQKLKDSENELTRRNEQTKKQLEQQAKDLEEKRRQFELEKSSWERENNVSLEELRRKSLEANSKEPHTKIAHMRGLKDLFK